MSKKQEVLLVSGVNGALFLLVIGISFLDYRLGIRIAAIIGTVVLAVLLIVPRLLKYPALATWHSRFLAVARNSKWMGVWTALWFLLHAITAFSQHLQFDWAKLWHSTTILGVVSLLILLMLLSISNSWSYQHVRWWKHMSMAIWLVPPPAFIHAWLAAPHFVQNTPFITASLFLLILLVGLLAHREPNPGYFTRHRTALLLSGALLGALTVWWNYSL